MTTGSLVSKLETAKSTSCLQKIAELRAQGVGDYISLPQLVVCGDQSAGKSSVLEGITGIPFPRSDGVCTKFATEITLTHNADDKTIIKATIIPDASRADDDKAQLSASKWVLKDFDELPTLISQVGNIMGLRGFGSHSTGPAFGADVLSIHVSGNTGRHLTVVDLPGLIAVANDEQTSEDVELVGDLVDRYIESPRTIIIAIVQASNDIANQRIIQKAQHFDTEGDRTVGVITKPDLINEGTEHRIAMLSRNEDTTKLKRGYFIVRNPRPKDLEEGIDQDKRLKLEGDFFNSSPWKEQHLDRTRVGMTCLTKYLQMALDEHIERELPKVHSQIRCLLEQTEKSLSGLGPERQVVSEMRAYLANISLKFHTMCRLALEGNYAVYGDSFFKATENRLRAEVHSLNTAFAKRMRIQGAKRQQLVDYEHAKGETSPQGDRPDEIEGRGWVLNVYKRTRGCELQGAHNATLLAELFQEQSSLWHVIAQEHLLQVHHCVCSFVSESMSHIVEDDQARKKLHSEVTSLLDKSLGDAKAELEKLWADERRFPLTYNHYYTDNIQKSRQESIQKILQDKIKGACENYTSYHALKSALDNTRCEVEVDMDAQACNEAITSLKAYYKVF
ncbi:Dynamin-2 [Dactylella cylindrospora]|nr:Dynamin-2 [Dactylella cylindrospora]